MTFAAKPPQGSQVVAGEWWPENYAGPPLVSMETDVAQGLGLAVGDRISVNVLGRVLTAKVANLRKVNWRSFGINFVMVFSPNAFAGAPFTQLMTLTMPQKPDVQGEAAILSDAAKKFPSVASVSMRESLATLGALLANSLSPFRAPRRWPLSSRRWSCLARWRRGSGRGSMRRWC